jgi:nucleoside-diphosphate-sugar epimerase
MVAGTRALVTGASGFIGRALVRRLVADGHEVVATSRHQPAAPTGTEQWVLADLLDPGAVRRLVQEVGPDVVFHLAALVSGTRAIESVTPMVRTNLLTTIDLLEVLTELRGSRLVLLGSGDEPTPPDAPCSPYAATKWAAGGYARMFHRLYGTWVAVVRPFMVYGPHQPDASKVVPHTITSLLRGERPMLASGRRRCDWVYIDDVVQALIAVAGTPACAGEVLQVGTGQLHTVREVVGAIVALLGTELTPAWGAHPDRPDETEAVADIEETRRLCGWVPEIDLETGLRRTVDWYRALVAEGPANASGQPTTPRP